MADGDSCAAAMVAMALTVAMAAAAVVVPAARGVIPTHASDVVSSGNTFEAGAAGTGGVGDSAPSALVGERDGNPQDEMTASSVKLVRP